MQTVSRVYDTYAHANQAVQDIEATGVPSSEVSLVANKYVSDKYENVESVSKAGTGAGIGGVLGGGAGLLAGLGVWRSRVSAPSSRWAGSPRSPLARLPARLPAGWSAPW